jgi:hypothetical protein
VSTHAIEPAPFVKDSFKHFESVMRKIKKDFSHNASYAVEFWEKWATLVPQSDDVNEYVAKYPLHVPLGEYLFDNVAVVPRVDGGITINRRRGIGRTGYKQFRTTDSVAWQGNGAYLIAPRVPIDDDGNDVAADICGGGRAEGKGSGGRGRGGSGGKGGSGGRGRGGRGGGGRGASASGQPRSKAPLSSRICNTGKKSSPGPIAVGRPKKKLKKSQSSRGEIDSSSDDGEKECSSGSDDDDG